MIPQAKEIRISLAPTAIPGRNCKAYKEGKFVNKFPAAPVRPIIFTEWVR
jgi:hypothetical protein